MLNIWICIVYNGKVFSDNTMYKWKYNHTATGDAYVDIIVPDEGHQDDMKIDPEELNLSAEMLYRVQNMMMPAQRDHFLKQAKQEKDKLDRDTAEYLQRQEENEKIQALMKGEPPDDMRSFYRKLMKIIHKQLALQQVDTLGKPSMLVAIARIVNSTMNSRMFES